MRSDVQLLRIVAAYGLVLFHSGVSAGKEIVYAGLIFFVIVSVFFAMRSDKRHGVRDRAERLLVPFILWSAVYGVLNFAAKGAFFPAEYGLLGKILASPSIHLWYLPFLFAALIAVDSMGPLKKNPAVIVTAGAAAAAMFATSGYWRGPDFPAPIANYLHVLPAVFTGIFLGGWKNLRHAARWITAASMIAAAAYSAVSGVRGVGVTYLAGFVLSLPLLLDSPLMKTNGFVDELGSATFGIYLVHIAALALVRRFGVPWALLAPLAFLVSAAVSFLFRRFVPREIVKYVM